MRTVLAALSALLLLSACSGDDEPTARPSASPIAVTWNPCDALDAGEVSAWFGVELTKDAGTPEAPACTFNPETEGAPVIDANYMLFPAGLDAAFEAIPGLDPDDVREVSVPGADAARVVVDFDDSQLFVTGFVQDGDLIQTVDVVDPRPYDEARVVRSVRSILAEFSAAAPAEGG